MKRIGIIILAAAAVISSCTGKKSVSSLEKAIEEEIINTLDGAYDFSIIELEKLDSTLFLTEFNRRINVFEMRIEANKKFLDDYFRRGLKKNAALKYDEIYKNYDILEALHAIKDRMGDSLYMVAYYDYRVKAQIKTGGIVRKTIGRVLKRNAQVLDDIYLAITPDNRVVSMNTDRKKLHQSTGLVIPGYSEIIKSESNSTEVPEDE